MRAVVCHQWCDAAGLALEDVPEPVLPAGHVRIRVHHAGINFADTLIIAGKYQLKPSLPFTPGFELSGEVLECAPGVQACKPGDRVMAVVDYGAFAEQAVTPEANVFVLPESVDGIAAAAFPVAYGTAHLGLRYRVDVKPGEVLVIHGAGGGVGLTAVEVGKKLGATIIATASSDEKLALARAAGADHVLNSGLEDLREQIKALSGGAGADVVYEPVGGALFEASLRSTRPGGRILVVGFASGDVPQIPANILLVKNISVIGFNWGAYRQLAPALMRRSCEELLQWLADGSLRPPVSQVFPLADVTRALQALRSRSTTGKVVLRIPD